MNKKLNENESGNNLNAKLIENDSLPPSVSIAGDISNISTDEKPKKKFPWLLALIFCVGVMGPLSLLSGLSSNMGNIITEKYGYTPATGAIASSLGTGLSLFIAPYFGNIKNSLIKKTNTGWFSCFNQILTVNKYLFIFMISSMIILIFLYFPQLGSYSENFYYGLLNTIATPIGTIASNLSMAWLYTAVTDTNDVSTFFALYHIIPFIFLLIGIALGPALSDKLSYDAYLGVNIFFVLISIGITIIAFVFLNAKQIQMRVKEQNETDQSVCTKQISEGIEDNIMPQDSKNQDTENKVESLTCTLRRIFTSPLFTFLMPLAAMSGYYNGASSLTNYLFLSLFTELNFDEINVHMNLIQALLLLGSIAGAIMSPLLGKYMGQRKLATFSLLINTVVYFFQAAFLSVKNPGMAQINFMNISNLVQGFFFSNVSIAALSMIATAIDYEYLYSGVRKEAIFSTGFTLISLLVGTITSTFLLSILEILGYQNNIQTSNDDEYLKSHYPVNQSQSVKAYLIIVTNWTLVVLLLVAAIVIFRYPAEKKEHELILAEIKTRDESPLTYSFHDPIFPQNSEANERRISFFAQGQKISVALQKEMESFFFYFSSTEIQLLQEPRGGKFLVQSRFKLDLTLLTCYTLIFFGCFLTTLIRGQLQIASLNLIFVLLAGFLMAYQAMRYPAMKKLKEMPVNEILEHATYCGKRRFIKHIKDVSRCKLVLVRLLPHAIAVFVAVIVIILVSYSNDSIATKLHLNN